MEKERNYDSFTEAVEDLSNAVQAVNPDRACLFGSAVELGLAANDFDILVISDSFKNRLFSNRKDMIPFPDKKPIDLWPYTLQEFSELYPEQNPIRESIEMAHINLIKNE
jgi:hypothetical protein